MFDKEFYPTPEGVIATMLAGKEVQEKNVLEPSAGSGNIVNYLQGLGANVVACERNDKLRSMLQCDVIGSDFFELKDISNIDMIVMNPPFSNANEHITHAYNIAPEGCHIIALCNYANFENSHRGGKDRFKRLVEDYGSFYNLGNVFSDAERKTDVEVALVELHKPILSADFDFEGFYFDNQEIEMNNGLIQHSEIRNIVEYYVRTIKGFQLFKAKEADLREFTKLLGVTLNIDIQITYGESSTSIDRFVKHLQKHCWKRVFNMLGIEKFLTSSAMEQVNKFVETQGNTPFTMKNIQKMVEIIIAMRDKLMNEAIIKAIDNFTMYTHGNRYDFEGWKTNAGHMLNKRFIIEMYDAISFNRGVLNISAWNKRYDIVNDLHKAMCYIKGVEYEDNLDTFVRENKIEAGTKFNWAFWECKVYLKGSMHFKFNDLKDWELLNRAYAKAKGNQLPKKF